MIGLTMKPKVWVSSLQNSIRSTVSLRQGFRAWAQSEVNRAMRLPATLFVQHVFVCVRACSKCGVCELRGL